MEKKDVATAINKAVTQPTLAIFLLYAVFSDEALQNCSAKGKRPNVKGEVLDEEVRPGLNEEGLDAVIGNFNFT